MPMANNTAASTTVPVAIILPLEPTRNDGVDAGEASCGSTLAPLATVPGATTARTALLPTRTVTSMGGGFLGSSVDVYSMLYWLSAAAARRSSVPASAAESADSTNDPPVASASRRRSPVAKTGEAWRAVEKMSALALWTTAR